jgi:sugar/nucleoside kinase (ribokinase family)
MEELTEQFAVPLPDYRTLEFVQDTGAAECLTAWAGITLAVTEDLVRAAHVGAKAMAFSVSRRGAQDSMPYPSELPIDWRL